MSSDEISVISIHEINCGKKAEEKTNDKNRKARHIVRSSGFLLFGIIGLCVLFAIPWTAIPRTNSIIYQSYWMEALLPCFSVHVLLALSVCLELTTWTKEKDLMSISSNMKLFFMSLAAHTFLYIICYAIWSAYLQMNHPMPFLGLIAIPMMIIFSIGLWFILPSHILAKEDFRQSLLVYMLYLAWIQALNIQKEILSYLFDNPPFGFQFLVPFMVAGARELDNRVKSKLVNKMNGSQDESAIVLVAVQVGCDFSFFIAIRLVDAALLTICSTVAIDFVLLLKMTHEILKELGEIYIDGHEHDTTRLRTKIAKLIVAEWIEGLAAEV